LYNVTLRYIILCYVMLYYAMIRYAILCYGGLRINLESRISYFISTNERMQV
jgi:hypothetical protein